jgi:hypothetical protein
MLFIKNKKPKRPGLSGASATLVSAKVIPAASVDDASGGSWAGRKQALLFEKRSKNFYQLSLAGRQRAPRPDKSLFASFSSEKEDLPYPALRAPARTSSAQ